MVNASAPLDVQMLMHVISFAFLMVLASTFVMIPVQLYLFGLQNQGWYWQHAALFAAMSASTDAVAVGAILKSGAGSEQDAFALSLETSDFTAGREKMTGLRVGWTKPITLGDCLLHP